MGVRIEACPRCCEDTPHRSIAIGPQGVLGLIAAGLAGVGSLSGWPPVSRWVLGFAALVLLLRERERTGFVRCERCRWKRVKAARKTRPVPGRSEIFFL